MHHERTKRGNFSIQTCLDALKAGPIAVINLRAFDSTLDVAGVVGLNPNVTVQEEATTPYVSLFNRSNFWVPNGKNITNILLEQNLLNFANVGVFLQISFKKLIISFSSCERFDTKYLPFL